MTVGSGFCPRVEIPHTLYLAGLDCSRRAWKGRNGPGSRPRAKPGSRVASNLTGKQPRPSPGVTRAYPCPPQWTSTPQTHRCRQVLVLRPAPTLILPTPSTQIKQRESVIECQEIGSFRLDTWRHAPFGSANLLGRKTQLAVH
jgi:hypothetical protein